jgi:gamma-glutamyltranspeptidase/glutathione hydrolase
MLHQKYGKLPWSELFEPAINLGRNGFPVTIDLAAAIAEENVTISDPLFAEIYAPNGTKLVEGDIGRSYGQAIFGSATS